jgi:pimeloyl-ACP methyl ester carboxylesterase
MPFLKREGRTRIYYEVHGNGTTPLILTHGYSSTSGMWHGQIDAFTKAGYKLIIWDMRGHGRSSYPDDQNAYSEAHTVADMVALLDHTCGTGCSAIVGGLSLGGYMSQAFYRDHQSRVESLLIIGKSIDVLQLLFPLTSIQTPVLVSKATKPAKTGINMPTKQQIDSNAKAFSNYRA